MMMMMMEEEENERQISVWNKRTDKTETVESEPTCLLVPLTANNEMQAKPCHARKDVKQGEMECGCVSLVINIWWKIPS